MTQGIHPLFSFPVYESDLVLLTSNFKIQIPIKNLNPCI